MQCVFTALRGAEMPALEAQVLMLLDWRIPSTPAVARAYANAIFDAASQAGACLCEVAPWPLEGYPIALLPSAYSLPHRQPTHAPPSLGRPHLLSIYFLSPRPSRRSRNCSWTRSISSRARQEGPEAGSSPIRTCNVTRLQQDEEDLNKIKKTSTR